MRGPWQEDPFEELLATVRTMGEPRTDRTGVGTRSLFAPDPLRYSLAGYAIPLITSKEVPWKMALREFMWMLSGSTDVGDLRGSSPAMAAVWENWADEHGSIGPTYGAQYRNAGGTLVHNRNYDQYLMGHAEPPTGVDQVRETLVLLAGRPNTRRAVISLWSVPELQSMQLEPCMVLFQFSLRGPNYDRLHLHVYQRSADMMLGVPFDLFQAGVFAHLMALELTKVAGRPILAEGLTWSAGDVHIYENQLAPVDLQLEQWASAEPMRATISIDPFPSLSILDGTLEPGHIRVNNYTPMPAIRAPLAV